MLRKSVYFQAPTCRQIVAARVALGWGQRELAEKAEVGVTTIRKLEGLPPDAEPMEYLRSATVKKLVQTLEEAGIEFFDEPDHARVGISFLRSPAQN